MSGKQLELRDDHTPSRNEGSRNDGTLIMENAQIVFRNFAGEERLYNAAGRRNFCVLLEEDLAQQMMEDGWNVKRLKPREGEENGKAYIQVTVGFKGRPPTMFMITSKGRVRIDEESCVLFDWADIAVVDLIIRPYHWNVSGNTGVKAYLKSLFMTINEDFLELKYSDVPEVALESAKPIQIEAGDGNEEDAMIEYDDDGNEVYVAELVDD